MTKESRKKKKKQIVKQSWGNAIYNNLKMLLNVFLLKKSSTCVKSKITLQLFKTGDYQELERRFILELLIGFKEGDSGAIKLLYQYFAPIFTGYVLQHKGDESEGKALTNYVLTELWRKLQDGTYIHENSKSFESFCFSIAVNQWLKELRKQSRIILSDFVEETPISIEEEVVNQKISKKILKQLIEKVNLSKNQKEVFIRRVFHKETYQEIGIALKKSEKAIKQLFHNAMKKIQQYIRQLPNRDFLYE